MREDYSSEENTKSSAISSAINALDVPDISKEQLELAYTFFSDTSAQLSRSYHFLENRVAQLTQELDEVSAEKKEQSEEKQQLAKRLETLLDFLPGGVVVLDAMGFVVQSNPAAREMLQHTLEGELWRDVIDQCFAPRVDDGLEVSTTRGLRISIATGSLDKAGQIILLTDQTETRRLQHKVSRYERLSAMGKMVSALAHQIRTPLSAALLYASHLSNENLNAEQREQFSGKLLGRLNHLEKHVRDMLLFVRNELPLNDEITMNSLEQGLKAAVEVAISSSSSYCIYLNEIASTSLKCNREALISALCNLVNNAIQSKENGTNIAVRMSHIDFKNQRYVRISVIDDGQGMSSADLEAAKSLFYTTKSQGTGLGLAVVQSVARAHGGYFTMQSKEGKGTRASILLPLSPSTLGDQ